jgi:phosphopantothenoylcysteine decarboxylase/phosphopantothenate--cysteine ligase
MGYALAAAAAARGASVTLISGPTPLLPPRGVNVVRVTSADEMFRATLNQSAGADLVLKSAAVADYRPEVRARGKLKKETLRRRSKRSESADRTIDLRLVATPDILEELGRRKTPGQVLVGFAAETDDLVENASKKLRKKNLDLVVANRIGRAMEGFEADTNRAIVVDRRGRRTELPLMTKERMAEAILDMSQALLRRRGLRSAGGRSR